MLHNIIVTSIIIVVTYVIVISFLCNITLFMYLECALAHQAPLFVCALR